MSPDGEGMLWPKREAKASQAELLTCQDPHVQCLLVTCCLPGREMELGLGSLAGMSLLVPPS